MKLGNRMWNLSWKLQTQLFIFPIYLELGTSWMWCNEQMPRCICELFTEVPRQRRHPQQLRTSREGWFQSMTNCILSLAPTENPARVWLCVWCLCQPRCREWAAACAASVQWAECFFGPEIAFFILPDRTLSLQKKPNVLHSIRLLSDHRLFTIRGR